MRITGERVVPGSERGPGVFNGGQHIFIDVEPNKFQTVSCRLPNGKHVTFAFVPSGNEQQPSNEIECVDLHCNCSAPLPRKDKTGNFHQQHLIGFTQGGRDPFDTRQIETPVALATLLLNSKHYTSTKEST